VYDVKGKTFTYTAANWPALEWYFEADMRAPSGAARAHLWDVTDGVSVTDSELKSTSSTFARFRSNLLTLVDGHKYRAEFATIEGDSGEVRSATVIGY
jgi:hypothetical protein